MNRNTALMSRRKKLPVALSIVATIFIQSPSYPILVTFRGLRLRGLGLHRVGNVQSLAHFDSSIV